MLKENSAALEKLYHKWGAADQIEVMKVAGQGHNYWPGFFQYTLTILVLKANCATPPRVLMKSATAATH